jgi:hypothetical protein
MHSLLLLLLTLGWWFESGDAHPQEPTQEPVLLFTTGMNATASVNDINTYTTPPTEVENCAGELFSVPTGESWTIESVQAVFNNNGASTAAVFADILSVSLTNNSGLTVVCFNSEPEDVSAEVCNEAVTFESFFGPESEPCVLAGNAQYFVGFSSSASAGVTASAGPTPNLASANDLGAATQQQPLDHLGFHFCSAGQTLTLQPSTGACLSGNSLTNLVMMGQVTTEATPAP